MNLKNKNGDTIHKDFIAGSFSFERVKEIIQKDETPLPAGFPKLWFSVYSGHVYVTNLTGVVLNKYKI